MITLTFTGRLGRDAETRTTQGGDKATSFTVATDLGWGDKKKTLWIDCTLWGERGDKLRQYLTRGQAVTVQGRPDLRTYEKDGQTRAVLTCTVGEIELQGGKRDGEGDEPRGGRTSGGGWETQAGYDDSSDIPF